MPDGRLSLELNAAAEELCREGLVVVIREPSPQQGRASVAHAIRSGAKYIEIALTTPGATKLIKDMQHEYPDAQVGAGSVLTFDQAVSCVQAGATYLVSPVFTASMVRWLPRLGVLLIPGTFTPTEAYRAWQLGFPLLKLFPAYDLGPAYVRSVLAPMPDLRFLVSGGITTGSAMDWVNAGARAVALTARASQTGTEGAHPGLNDLMALRAALAKRASRGSSPSIDEIPNHVQFQGEDGYAAESVHN